MKKLWLSLLVLLALVAPASAQITTAQKFRLLTGVGGSDCVLSIGSGSPEGVLTGGVCDMYFRTDGGASTTVYVKQSGTGNTGWAGIGSGGGGTVSGPGSSTNHGLAAFNGTGGTTLEDAGILTSAVTTLTGSQTLTNKTLTSPIVNTPTGIVKGDVGLGNVDNTSDATKNSASVTLTNKTLTTPVISTISNTGTITLPTSTDTLVGRATTDTLTNKTLTTPTIGSFANATHTHTNSAGGGTLAEAALALTDVTTNNSTTSNHGFLLKLDNNAAHFMNGQGAWATPSGGGSGITGPGSTTSGNIPVWNSTDGTTVGAGTIAASNVALLDANNIFTNASGNSVKKTVYPGSSSGSVTVLAPSVAGTTTLLFPGVNTSDVLVSRDSTDTLTNKTLTTPTIGSFTNSTHTHTNAAGGGTLAEGALALTDITTNNSSTSNHGFLKKLDNDSTHFMDGTGSWSVPSGGGGGTSNAKRTGYMQWDPDATFVAGKEWVGLNGCTDGTINSDVSTTGGIYVSHFSGSTINNAVNIGCNTWAWPDHLPTVIIKFKTGPSITDLRFWAGLSASSATSNCTSFNTDDPSVSNVKIIGFRYSTVASDGGFVGYTSTGSGSNKTVSSTVNTIALSTEYTLKIVVNSTSSVSFTVNGGTAQTITTNIPSGAALGPFLCAINTNATTKRVDMSRFYVEAN